MAFKQGHALVIGVGTYQYAPQYNVPIAVADAQAVAEVLKDPAFCGYPEQQLKFLKDEAADRAGVLAALDELAQKAGPDDTVFVYYCGHGALGDDNQYYLISHDARVTNRVAQGTGISAPELIEKFAALKAGRVLMVINACYSGNLSPAFSTDEEESLALDSTPPADATAALLGTGKGRIIITASRENQKSWIGQGPLSYFTQALVDGLRGKGVGNQRGFISAYRLYEYVYECVSDIVSQLHQQQEPELTVLKGIGPFAVALWRGASNFGGFDETQPAPDLPTVRAVEPAEAKKLYQKFTQTGGVNLGHDNKIEINGGTIAGRDAYNAPVIHGEGSTGMITNPTGPVNQHFGSEINTGGGAYIGGNVNVGNGNFIGRDQVNITHNQGINAAELVAVFAPLFDSIQSAQAANQAQVMQKAAELQAEAAKGKAANDMKLSTLITDFAQEAAPEVVKTLVNLFTVPPLGNIAGPVTKLILNAVRPKD